MKCSVDGCERQVCRFEFNNPCLQLEKDKSGETLEVFTSVAKVGGGEVCQYHTVRGVARLLEDYEDELAGG